MKIQMLAFIVSLNSLSAFSQALNPQELYAIDTIAKKYVKEYAITGLSMGIVQNSENYTFHYGNIDLTNKYPVSDSTMFHLASITKLFTATAIMQLVENGELRLDDRVVDILPEFNMKDKRSERITIWHLLTHTSGLMWDNKVRNSPNNSSSIPLFIKKLNKRNLNFNPGEKLSYETYSNVAFDLLGIIIEKKSGEQFDEYVKQHILIPVEMEKSTFYYKIVDPLYLAWPIVISKPAGMANRLNLGGLGDKDLSLLTGNKLKLKRYDVYGEEYEHHPSGNLISSARELNLWMQHVLKIFTNPEFMGVVKHSTLLEMWSIQKNIPGKKTSIGLGWWIYQDESLGKSVFHVGNNPGFCSILMIYPERNFGISILCNASYAQKAVWNKMALDIEQLLVNK